MPELTRRASLPLQTRAGTLQPTSWDEGQRTIQVCWTTGAAVRRRDPWNGLEFDELLVVEPGAVNMARFEAGAVQVLDNHDRFTGVGAILGVATKGWLAGGMGLAVLQLSDRAEVAGIVADIAKGVIRTISFGYSVEQYEVVRAQDRKDGGTVDLWRAVKWTPQEISFVSVPADPGAGTRAAPQSYPCDFTAFTKPTSEKPTMTTTTQRGARSDAEVAEIHALVARARLPGAFANDLVQRGMNLDQAGAAIIDELAQRDRAAGGHMNVDARAHGRAADALPPSMAMQDALVCRLTGTQARDNPYQHARVADMARELLELRGIRTTAFSPDRLIERALHTTSDFPELLQGAGQRVLRQAYGSYAGGLKRVARSSTARDFRAKSSLALSEFPELLKVGEHSEFKHGSMGEAKASYALATYGRIFGITRQSLINDDLDAFADMVTKAGRAAAELEAKTLVDLLVSNPTMGDSVALFHATHANLGTGAGSALQISSLTTARTAMRLVKGMDGKTPIDATPRYLVVPAALETTGQQLITSLTPNQISSVNPFAGTLELVVDPRLDAASTTAWYLAADPSVIDGIEYAYLESAGGPEILLNEGWEVDGVEIKARLDFGAGVLDHRGLYKANGA